MNIPSDAISLIVSGIFTLLGVALGSIMSRKSSRKEYRKEYLAKSYAAFFSSAYWVIVEHSDETIHNLVTTAEALKLMCCDQSSELIDKIITACIDHDIKSEIQLIKDLRSRAKHDIGD